MKDYSTIELPKREIRTEPQADRFVSTCNKGRRSYRRASIAVLALFAVAIVVAVVYIVISSLRITHISIEGNEYYTDEELCAVASLGDGTKFLKFNADEAAETLYSTYPRIGKVSVKKRFPGSVSITVQECKELFYFEYGSRFYTMTELLRVVEKSKQSERYESAGLIFISLPEVISVKTGNVPELTQSINCDYVFNVIKLFSSDETPFVRSGEIRALDLSHKFDISFELTDGSVVELGDESELNAKLALAMRIFDDIGDRHGIPVRVNVENPLKGWYSVLQDNEK